MKLAGRIAHGVSGRMAYEYACNRGGAFNEAWVHSTISDVLAGNVDSSTHRVKTNRAVAALAGPPKLRADGTEDGRGATRKVDLAVERLRAGKVPRTLTHCVEVKWANSNYATPESVLEDLVRLALVKQAMSEVQCIFVLAGQTRRVTKLVGQMRNVSNRGGGPLFLRTHPGQRHRYMLRSNGHTNAELRAPLLLSLEAKYALHIPNYIATSHQSSAHQFAPRHQVRTWEIIR